MTGAPTTPDRYPWWVKLGRFGARSRKSQQFWAALSVVVGVVLLVLGVILVIEGDPLLVTMLRAFILFSGFVFLGAAAAYVAVIRWVDRHGTWDS